MLKVRIKVIMIGTKVSMIMKHEYKSIIFEKDSITSESEKNSFAISTLLTPNKSETKIIVNTVSRISDLMHEKTMSSSPLPMANKIDDLSLTPIATPKLYTGKLLCYTFKNRINLLTRNDDRVD